MRGNIQVARPVVNAIRVADGDPATLKPGEGVSLKRAAEAFFARRGITHPGYYRPRPKRGTA